MGAGVFAGTGKLAGRFCVREKVGNKVRFLGCFKSKADAEARRKNPGAAQAARAARTEGK